MATAKQLEYLTQLTGEDWLSIVGVKYPRLTRNKADWLIRSVKNIRLGHITDVGVVNSVVYFIKNWFPSFSFDTLPSSAEVHKYYNTARLGYNPYYATQETDGEVYFIVGEETNLVKIGYSEDVASRLSNLRGESPVKLRLLFSFPASRATEVYFHKKFAQYKSHREWFRIEGELKDFIEEHT